MSTMVILPIKYPYIGCILVAVISLLVILLFILNKENQLQGTNFQLDSENASRHACTLAGDSNSFLSYLKKLDKHSIVTFPHHCRTIDFYLENRNNEMDVALPSPSSLSSPLPSEVSDSSLASLDN